MNQASPQPRLDALDGVRGFAALIVFFHHALGVFYPVLNGFATPASASDHHAWLPFLHHVPVGWLVNGPFAVAFFFVLSGFVLTFQVARTTPRFDHLVVRRFLRLLPLVCVSSLVGFALFHGATAGLDAIGQFNGLSHNDFFDAELAAHPSFSTLLLQCVYTVWHGSPAPQLFDPVLWSIGTEFQGSVLVYICLCIFAGVQRPVVKYAAMGIGVVLLIGPMGACFVVGMACAEAYLRFGRVLPLPPWALRLGVLAVLVYASVNPFNPSLWIELPYNAPPGVGLLLQALASAVLLAAAVQLPSWQSLFGGRAGRFLGFVSYGLYVIHVPLLYAGAAPLAAWLQPRWGYDGAVAAATAALLVASVAAGYGLIRWVDMPLNARCKQLVLRGVR